MLAAFKDQVYILTINSVTDKINETTVEYTTTNGDSRRSYVPIDAWNVCTFDSDVYGPCPGNLCLAHETIWER